MAGVPEIAGGETLAVIPGGNDVVFDDGGYSDFGCYGSEIHPQHRPARRRRTSLPELPHHFAVLADAGFAAHKAIRLVSDQQSVAPDRPFFLYLAFGAGHSPHHVPKEMIDAYVPLFEKRWDATRVDRLMRQKATGLVPSSTELPPRNPGVPVGRIVSR